jgi:hypothetical protein
MDIPWGETGLKTNTDHLKINYIIVIINFMSSYLLLTSYYFNKDKPAMTRILQIRILVVIQRARMIHCWHWD